MSLAAGTRLGSYEIVSSAGAGGMGEVYRARDARLERDVAIKLLSAEFSSDAHRLARFQQEARSASALNHPNIITVHDIGTLDSGSYIVMELVEGRTLRELLHSGPLPLKKALQVAAQIADGLAKAHDAGIVHRDIKPENVMVTRDGFVKILDFGLAKLALGETGEQPTVMTMPKTHPGMVLGTVGYMSPEQARGEPSDFRSDQFSFGSLFYEMLTGRRPFSRESPAQTMAAIIEDEPKPIGELNARVPVPVRWIVDRCLAKDPHDRYASTRDLARDLQSVRDHLSEASTSASSLVAAPGAATRRPWLLPALWAGTGALLTALVATLVFYLFRAEAPEPPALRYYTFSGYDADPAVSPDGRTIAFSSSRDGTDRIWLKQVNGVSEVPLTGGPDSLPRFSPDGASILFRRREDQRHSLFRVATLGGEPRRLISDALVGDWSPDGSKIVYVTPTEGKAGTEFAVHISNSDGSNSREVYRTSGLALHLPRWSPDGKHIAIVETPFGTSGARQIGIVLLSTDGAATRRLFAPVIGGQTSNVVWTSDSRSVIYSQAESTARAALSTTPLSRIWLQDVQSGRGRVLLWVPALVRGMDVLSSGQLLLAAEVTRINLRQHPMKPGAQPNWFTRGSSVDRQPIYSPDGNNVLFTSNRSGNLDLWAVGREAGSVHRITDHSADDWDPAYVRATGKILFSSNRGGHFEIWSSDADGSNPRQVSNDGQDAENPTATPDGEWIVYSSGSVEKRGVWKIRGDGSEPKHLVGDTTAWPEVSPDGRHFLYTIQRGGRSVIEVANLSDGRMIFRIDRVGGSGRSRFTADGSAIAFVTDLGGQVGLVTQQFIPGQDTTATRKMLVQVEEDDKDVDTFAFSPDGRYVTVGLAETSSSLLIVDGVSGVKAARGP